jgi:hypothetical protein
MKLGKARLDPAQASVRLPKRQLWTARRGAMLAARADHFQLPCHEEQKR